MGVGVGAQSFHCFSPGVFCVVSYAVDFVQYAGVGWTR